jgi:hypothetical protein
MLSEGWNDAGVPPVEVVNYYMVPGTGHCGGGEGTDHFDLFAVLQQWAEQKQAPGDVVASRIENCKEIRTRTRCAYPEIASYKGTLSYGTLWADQPLLQFAFGGFLDECGFDRSLVAGQ